MQKCNIFNFKYYIENCSISLQLLAIYCILRSTLETNFPVSCILFDNNFDKGDVDND